jgi:hypothetical protein
VREEQLRALHRGDCLLAAAAARLLVQHLTTSLCSRALAARLLQLPLAAALQPGSGLDAAAVDGVLVLCKAVLQAAAPDLGDDAAWAMTSNGGQQQQQQQQQVVVYPSSGERLAAAAAVAQQASKLLLLPLEALVAGEYTARQGLLQQLQQQQQAAAGGGGACTPAVTTAASPAAGVVQQGGGTGTSAAAGGGSSSAGVYHKGGLKVEVLAALYALQLQGRLVRWEVLQQQLLAPSPNLLHMWKWCQAASVAKSCQQRDMVVYMVACMLQQAPSLLASPGDTPLQQQYKVPLPWVLTLWLVASFDVSRHAALVTLTGVLVRHPVTAPYFEGGRLDWGLLASDAQGVCRGALVGHVVCRLGGLGGAAGVGQPHPHQYQHQQHQHQQQQARGLLKECIRELHEVRAAGGEQQHQ